MEKRILAFDLGASSGRAMLGRYDGKTIQLDEVHRFDNNPVMLRGAFYWDILDLFSQIKQGMGKAAKLGEITSIGIDTWGVDFGLLDKNGDLVQNPVHYRDERTVGMPEEVEGLLGKNELYKRTGIQLMALNTVFQLYALKKYHPEVLAASQSALLTPDLLGYFLTGEKTAEYSIASTTQMMNPYTHQWDAELLTKLGLPQLFPSIVPSGRALGAVTADILEELGIPSMKVVSVCGHDTGSAVAAAPAIEEEFIYISCGTWSLFGTEAAAPLINEKTQTCNIANEGGYGYTTRLLKNICALWLIQETRRQYRREGSEYSYNDLEKHALAAKPFQYFIDADNAELSRPGNLPRRICAYCEQTGQGSPQTVGEIMRCIYESIAMKYRYVFEQIKDCTGKNYRQIHMMGGGTKDNLLCKMAASSMDCTVIAGPIEATALGNLAVQLITNGELASLADARSVIRSSFTPLQYSPADAEAWSAAYGKYRAVMKRDPNFNL